jgi:spore coat polysaccharide biosynthesis protein SpsF
MPKVVASIEARMASQRLPGKVLADIGGAPALTRLVRRLRMARFVDDIVLATTTSCADDALVSWAAREGVAVHRGSEDDVLGRVVGAHQTMGSDIVVEVCGDTPLIAPELVDRAVEVYRSGAADVVTSTVRPSYPQGCDTQVFGFATLAEVARTIDDAAVREHVSLYFYEHPERYRIHHLEAPASCRLPEQRLQVDYPEDLTLVREIYARLEPRHGDRFSLDEIVALLTREPRLAALNRHCTERPAR